ncbi:hypothetical protein DFH09DRAFT_1157800 [Mycena vulgaris]|nr:hypothetical protein DFH09DRAFT_1157800 [Mycena vulgaris]
MTWRRWSAFCSAHHGSLHYLCDVLLSTTFSSHGLGFSLRRQDLRFRLVSLRYLATTFCTMNVHLAVTARPSPLTLFWAVIGSISAPILFALSTRSFSRLILWLD